MQRVYFCTAASFLTGDDVADAAIEYALVLQQYGRHDVVRVPTRHADGSPGRSTLLLGPTSQISSEDVVGAEDELIDREFVLTLKTRSAHLREPLPVGQYEDELGLDGA